MQRKHSSALRANIKASTSFPQSGTELGDIFICGTAKACSVKDCFKRSTHFHCSLCPDRKVVKEQNMVAHQIFHVTGRIEKRSVRDTHFIAYSGTCGRSHCRFSLNNRKHHHCKICEWPCCGRKLQRCVGHIKSKHPEIPIDSICDSVPTAGTSNGGSSKKELDDSGTSGDLEDSQMELKEEDEETGPTTMIVYEEDQIIKVCEEPERPEMIELNSMVWHHPAAKKSRVENAASKRRVKQNGNHENGLMHEDPYHSDAENEQKAMQMYEGPLDHPFQEQQIKQNVPLSVGAAASCRVHNCQETKIHFHCHLCEFFTLKKALLDRHRNIHARGFIEKRKKREMYFNGSDIACGIPDCRFTVVKQRHHHCKICSWACSSRKLQRCIKHIQDRHGIVLDNDPIDEMSYENPQVIADPDMSCPPVYVPLDESTQDSSNNGESNDSQMSDATGSDMTPPDKKLSDPLSAEALSVDGIPHEDELFFLSKAEIRCVVDQCALLGPHYHCQRCPYVTRQKHCRGRHRAIHLKGFPERRMIRDLHFIVYEGVCGRTCRFSMPKRKHFHCKYCDWACCARKLPRILNHLKRKHSEVLKDTNVPSPSSGFKRPRDYQGANKNGHATTDVPEEENKVIILEEEGSQCGFIIKDVHSLRDNGQAASEPTRNSAEPSRKPAETPNHIPSSPLEKVKEAHESEKGFKPYKPPAYAYSAGFMNGHAPQVAAIERPLTCRICHSYPSESLPLRKMVVYSTSNRLELDLRLTSLLCTYFRVSIEEAFNNYICERDFEEWCTFHARKISVYPVIAVESSFENIHHPHVIQVDEHYVQY